MLGLFGSLNLGTRSLAAQRQGVEVAGQNLANVNNTAYARQRLVLQTASPVTSTIGSQGSGVDGVAIQQIRNTILDGRITSENSIAGYLEARQSALQYTDSGLGEQIDNNSSQTDGASSTSAVGAGSALGSDLSNFFNTLQTLATQPASLTNRQDVLSKAGALATQFNQTSSRLQDVHNMLNDTVQADVSSANELLSGITSLNKQIVLSENTGRGAANDLRDLRQQKLEELSRLTNIDTVSNDDGSVNVSVGGALIVSGMEQLDSLQSYDAGGGQWMVRSAAGGTPLALTSGRIQGSIATRDGSLHELRSGLDSLASTLISSVNTIHAVGYDLNGNTGKAFFTGSTASSIQVNTALADDPAGIQASGMAGATGDNTVVLQLAQLGTQRLASLGNQTFGEQYSAGVATLAESISSTNNDISDQNTIQSMLKSQRASYSGVSLDEEMTDLIKYQKAFEASARLINTIDEMISQVVNLGR
jgi:flagellar hook-associated protein 1 FlgK